MRKERKHYTSEEKVAILRRPVLMSIFSDQKNTSAYRKASL